MKQLKKYLVRNKKTFIFLSILVLIAIGAGSVFSVTLSSNDTELVKNYITNYISSIKNNELVLVDSFFSSLINNLSLILVLFLLGLSVIGIPIVIVIFFYKSFIFGFTLGSILINYKVKGILLSIIYMFPHNVLDIFILIIYSIMIFNIFKRIISTIIKKEPLNIYYFKKYFKVTLFILLIYIFISLYSSHIVPILIRSIMI